jgi:hypothetical protein
MYRPSSLRVPENVMRTGTWQTYAPEWTQGALLEHDVERATHIPTGRPPGMAQYIGPGDGMDPTPAQRKEQDGSVTLLGPEDMMGGYFGANEIDLLGANDMNNYLGAFPTLTVSELLVVGAGIAGALLGALGSKQHRVKHGAIGLAAGLGIGYAGTMVANKFNLLPS